MPYPISFSKWKNAFKSNKSRLISFQTIKYSFKINTFLEKCSKLATIVAIKFETVPFTQTILRSWLQPFPSYLIHLFHNTSLSKTFHFNQFLYSSSLFFLSSVQFTSLPHPIGFLSNHYPFSVHNWSPKIFSICIFKIIFYFLFLYLFLMIVLLLIVFLLLKIMAQQPFP